MNKIIVSLCFSWLLVSSMHASSCKVYENDTVSIHKAFPFFINRYKVKIYDKHDNIISIGYAKSVTFVAVQNDGHAAYSKVKYKTGTWKEYHNNGVLKNKGKYTIDISDTSYYKCKRINVWRFYNDKGTMVDEMEYPKK